MALTKRIIPCIDVDLDEDGNPAVYTGVNFEDLKYTGDPVEMAKLYNEAGADEFVFLDITASAEGRETMLDTVSKVADEVFIPLTVGGGIRDTDDIKETLRAGADKVSINTGALERPELITEGARAFGNQCIVISVDARRRYDEAGEHYEQVDGESCWFEATVKGGREGTGVDVVEWSAEAAERGADVGDEGGVDDVVGVQAASGLGAADDVTEPGWVGCGAGGGGVEGFLVDEEVDGGAWGAAGGGGVGGGGAGHGQQGIGAALGFGALQVAGDDVVVGAEAVAGFGPVGVPFGFGEPAEDLGEFGAVGVGEEAGEVVAAVGAGTEVEASLVLALFVAGAVAVGVGEGFPHAGVGFEVGVGEGLGVVEQFGCVTVEQFARDARVGDDAGHQGGLGDADGADGFASGPIGEAVMHAGGL